MVPAAIVSRLSSAVVGLLAAASLPAQQPSFLPGVSAPAHRSTASPPATTTEPAPAAVPTVPAEVPPTPPAAPAAEGATTPIEPAEPAGAATAAAESTDVVSGTWGVDFTTGYWFRGIPQEDQGVIAQPYFEFGYVLYEGDGAFESVSLVFGQWNSLHDGPTGSGATGQSMWYESDFYAGLTASLGERWSATLTYTSYYSPNARFGTVEELGFGLNFDDGSLLGESFPALKPSAVIAFELDGQADGGSARGTYGQLAIEPSFALGGNDGWDFALSLPMTAGFSLGDYYQNGNDDSSLGYFDVGAVLSSPLPFMPTRLGPWTASLGLHVLTLGDANEALNSGEDTEFVGSFGLSTSF